MTEKLLALGRHVAGPDEEQVEEVEALDEMSIATNGWTENGRLLREGFYCNSCGYSVAIVAVITPGVDWSAYIGGFDGRVTSEEETVRWVGNFGARLPKHLALAVFSFLPIDLWRA